MALNDTINYLCPAEIADESLTRNKHFWDLHKRQACNQYAIKLAKSEARLCECGDPSTERKGNGGPLEDSKRRR